MYHPTTRVLAVLELLQAHGRMTGAEIARRLEVDVRTARRYIEMLQDLGIPVEGERGRLLADYSSRQVYAEPGADIKTPPESIPLSIGHHQEWIEACKTRKPTTCNFDYSGALSEAVLLGNVSYRAGGKKLQWDADSLKATNCPEADAFIKREYRAGWTLG